MNNHFSLILAAGFSSRMGTCKTTLPWCNSNLLRYQVEQFLLAKITPIVVLGSHNAHRQIDCIGNSLVAINPHSDRGKVSSIITGLQLLPSSFLSLTISAVDQPRSSHVYRTLRQTYQSESSLIVAPTDNSGKLGHPLLFSSRLLPEIENIQESTLGLRNLVRQYYAQIKQVKFSNSEVFSNLNYPIDYQVEISK